MPWTAQTIASLSTEDTANLRKNAADRGAGDIVDLCDAELMRRTTKELRKAQGGTKKQSTSQARFGLDSVTAIAELIAALPPASSVPNGVARHGLQKNPVATLGQLWRIFLVCSLSSQENCEPGSRLSRFIEDNETLLDLQVVLDHGGNPIWIEQEIRPSLPRMWQKKVALVTGAFAHFKSAGKPTARLTEICKDEHPLKLFCDLARGVVSDRDLATSGTFSAALSHKAFPQVGDKQFRNILVNSGLACNVVPLDSRWQSFFGEVLTVEPADFNRRTRYLEIEDVLRKALIQAQRQRGDIDNLAVLDAIVFAHMSQSGPGVVFAGSSFPQADDQALAKAA